MANIVKNNNTYKITVSCGYDVKGKKIRQYKTWKPDNGMTDKQAEKEVQKVALMFEQECLRGSVSTSIKFEDFAVKWFNEYVDIALKSRTVENYHWLEKRAYKAIGHLRMDKITPRHIQQFITDMVKGKRTDKKKGKLSPKTIKDHISFISTIFTYAEKMQVVSTNPCKAVTLPRANSKEKEIYTLEETQQLLELLVRETDNNKSCALFIILAIYTGFRRGDEYVKQKLKFFENIFSVLNTA